MLQLERRDTSLNQLKLPPLSLPDDYAQAIYDDKPTLLGLGNVTYIKTFNDYLLSPFGIDHFRQPNRYGDFKYGSPDDFIADYTIDVHPVLHQYVNAKETEALLDDEVRDGRLARLIRDFKPYDIQLGRLIGWHHEIDENESPVLHTHDIETVGDIRTGHKTDEHRAKLRIVRHVLQGLIKVEGLDVTIYNRFPHELLDKMNAVVEHRNPHDPVEHLQESSHTIGFLRAGLRGMEIAETTPDHEQGTERFRKSEALGKVVLPNAVNTIEKAGLLSYVRVARLLDKNHRVIDRARDLQRGHLLSVT